MRHCIKCGREIGPNETICATCNAAGMATPSASQYHGTVAAAIVLAVILMAVAASLSMRGVGPYAAEVRAVEPGTTAGYAVTYAVTNEGPRPGRAKCQRVALGDAGQRLRTKSTITDEISGGGTAEETEQLPGLEERPTDVTVRCS